MITLILAETESLFVDIAFTIEIILLAIFAYFFRSKDKSCIKKLKIRDEQILFSNHTEIRLFDLPYLFPITYSKN